ncbi:hypothetical protein SAMN05421769_3403 [Chryseobacterium scophthalmum]|uniref:Uncharacterized protein n=1 Tax=Chryseobacterium scophthalmum TaxID=59733 RepID=A0A1N6IF55_9FLAO|nr:hypothetical protein SAMN05421769_3403 [Chryseobacterium scophthalmum]
MLNNNYLLNVYFVELIKKDIPNDMSLLFNMNYFLIKTFNNF